MKKTKIFGIFIALALLMLTSVFAAGEITEVKIDGDNYDTGDVLGVELGDDLDIRVEVKSSETLNDVQLEAKIVGYDHVDDVSDTYDIESIDELKANTTYKYDLDVSIPSDADEDYYYLYVELYSRDDGLVDSYQFKLDIDFVDDEKIIIKRVNLDPAAVIAGRALRTSVKLENLGKDDADDVYVKVAIPELGPNVYVTTDVDEVESGDTETTEDLLLRIPSCARAGTYQVVVTATYDDDYESTTVVQPLTILEGDACESSKPAVEDKTVVTPPSVQDLVAGQAGASYPIMIGNLGSEDKTYLVSVSGVSSWGSAEVSNPAPLIRSGETQVVYVYVNANEGIEGLKNFVITISDGKSKTDIPAQANVIESQDNNSNAWIYGLIIFLVIVVIVLVFAVVFRKKDDDEEEYY